MTERQLDLSVIVPLYNEEESIVLLHEAITKSLERLPDEYEIVFVDDGSSDDTFAIGCSLTKSDPRLRIIKFRKNFGQTPAMAAGIDYARGRILVTMDGDLQNDPEDIPRFLTEVRKGYDIVVGWRANRQDKLVTRKIPSKIANWLIGKVTGVPIKDNGCSLKAYRARIIKNVVLYSDLHRFIPAMASMTGARIAEIKVRHHARRYGTSKYGLSRIYKVLLDLLTVKTLIAFTARPLIWFSILAVPAFLAGGLALTAVMFLAGDGSSPLVILATIAALYASLGISLVLAGALAELVYRTGSVKVTNLSALITERLEPGPGERISAQNDG